MNLDTNAVSAAIKAKVVEIAAQLGGDATDIRGDDIVPATGLIDSAGLLELIAWYEDHYQIPLAQEEITIDNLGTIDQMTQFVLRRKGLL